MPLERPMLELPAIENRPEPAGQDNPAPPVQATSSEPLSTAGPAPDVRQAPAQKRSASMSNPLTVAGLALTPKTARAAVLYAEILGRPVSRQRRRFGRL